MIRRAVVSAALIAAASACGDDQDPARAAELWDRVHAEGYRGWGRPPAYPGKAASNTAHGDEVEIFVNAPLDRAMRGPRVDAWPEGSIVVKDITSRRSPSAVAIAEKRGGAWFWAEYDASGDPIWSGQPAICVDCHAPRARYSDWLYSAELPR